jgi:bifunctional non-homologous end joining protein LigD
MPLLNYWKRDFNDTPEPACRNGPLQRAKRRIFVVQKHAASRLHYDFRLEVNGVLASWAVPKGPSMNPAERRLVMRTEDHPLEYAGFEGIIPPGHHGAGTMIVWDTGTYESYGDGPFAEQLEQGGLKFTLAGRKLRGGFALIRGAGRRWFLIKRRDEYAKRFWNIDRDGRSVLSGRTLEDVVRHPAVA